MNPRSLVAPIALFAAYAAIVRPRLLHWGATKEEVEGPYPGADIIPGGARSATMAVTIDAPPSRVWPWLAQMGYGRGGWYSWDHLDNWGNSSVKELHPEWQRLEVGDHIPSMPGNKGWWEVAALEPERFLGLRASVDLRGRPFDPSGPYPRFFSDSLWAFQLKETEGGGTRLVVSGYWNMRPRWLQKVFSVLLLEPSHWVMQTRQFANLKRRVEESSAPAAEPAALRA
jgi:uncharacterized protein YndB with AHSA1/START domain